MKTIPVEQIDLVWERMNQSTQEEAERLAQRMQRRQPAIMVYLLAMDESLYDEAERGRLMELGAIIWEVMSASHPKLREVTPAELDAAETANMQFLQQLDEGAEADFASAGQKMLARYNQMPLLGAVLEGLMAGHEERPELAPESTGPALLYLKTVIDCLDQ
jgi:hypothetical protein